MSAPPVRRLPNVLKDIRPESTLVSTEEVPSNRLLRFYRVTLSNGEELALALAPSLTVRLLRHEHTLLISDAVLRHIVSSTVADAPLGREEPSPGVMFQSDPTAASNLASLIPKVLKCSSDIRDLGCPYTLSTPNAGQPLRELVSDLSLSEKHNIDRQLGYLVRDLASITSPSGRFGPASRVLDNPFRPEELDSSALPRGSVSWTCAFMSMMEGTLRDGEDMSIVLPYDDIRCECRRLAGRLQAVTIPRLVVVDIGDPNNILIGRNTPVEGLAYNDVYRITGLRDWSYGVFGDPLLATCFDNPSEAFSKGWKQEENEEMIEDREGAPIRILLYRCYRAVVAVVTEYYRPRPDSSKRELDGRKELTTVLAALTATVVDGGALPKRAGNTCNSYAESGGWGKRPKCEEPEH